MTTFTFVEDAGVRKNTKPKVLISKFGDSYEQRQGDGINLLPRSWSLSYILRTNSEADDIENFLRARYGVESFDWTPPGEITAIKVKCTQWDRVLEQALRSTITCVFEELFEP